MTTLRVPITKNQSTLIDEEDAEFVLAHRWYALPAKNGTFYAARSGPLVEGKRTHFLLHRELMNAQQGQFIDHINLDRLDNRRENLRFATPSQNQANRGLPVNNTTGYKGVRRVPYGRWIAFTKRQGRRVHFGTFDTVEEAVLAYNRGMTAIHGEFARANEITTKTGDIEEP